MPLVRVVTACLPDLRLCGDVLPGAVRNSIADELPEIAPGRLDLNSLVHAQRHSDAVQIKAPRFLRFAHFAENGLDLLGTDMQKPRPTRGSPAGVADRATKAGRSVPTRSLKADSLPRTDPGIVSVALT